MCMWNKVLSLSYKYIYMNLHLSSSWASSASSSFWNLQMPNVDAYDLRVVTWKISRYKRRHASPSSLSSHHWCTPSNSHAIVYDLHSLLLLLYSCCYHMSLLSNLKAGRASAGPAQCELFTAPYQIAMCVTRTHTTTGNVCLHSAYQMLQRHFAIKAVKCNCYATNYWQRCNAHTLKLLHECHCWVIESVQYPIPVRYLH